MHLAKLLNPVAKGSDKTVKFRKPIQPKAKLGNELLNS